MIDLKGVTRIVFVFKDFVIKIPNFTCQWNHFLKGLLANMSERSKWETAKKFYPETTHLLCPVKWATWGGWILVMERAQVFSFDIEPGTIDYSIWENAGHGGDDKPQNYGTISGRIVKIDYA